MFRVLVGDDEQEDGEIEMEDLNLPESFDPVLRRFAYVASVGSVVKKTEWTSRALAVKGQWAGEGVTLQKRTRYKPVDRKVRPVPSYMPDPAGQVFKPVEIGEIPKLGLKPRSWREFTGEGRLTEERLKTIIEGVPEGFLQEKELDLLVEVLASRNRALAFDDYERGTFSPEYFPDYKIPVIEHTPWVQTPLRIPKAIEEDVIEMLKTQKAAGKYEDSTASYRGRMFAVAKKKGIRLVQDVQELNKVTIRDAGLPPRVDDFAEGFVGCAVYGLCDLFSGYDGRRLAEESRPLTTFGSLIGTLRNCALPQGATNAVPEFQRCVSHVIRDEAPRHADAFIDDVGIKGPTTWYGGEEIVPGIRRTIYEYATTLDRLLARFLAAGITASGKKLVLATPHLGIVGTIVSLDGWHLEKGLATKVENWPSPTTVSEVWSFLGTAGVGRRWIEGFALIARPLTLLTRDNHDFAFGESEQLAMDELKKRVASAPVLVKINYEEAKKFSKLTNLAETGKEGLVIVGVDSSKYGAGWILQQVQGGDKRAALFGSCTFTETEGRYSQPKCELFGVFRALKGLRHRVWGVHFVLEVDAKFLKEMMNNPELPNAPMNRWIVYIALFDFMVQHIPVTSHKGPDGLSRRPKAEEDTDESDVEEYLERVVGKASGMSVSKYLNWNSGRMLDEGAGDGVFKELAWSFRRMPDLPYASFLTRKEAGDMFCFELGRVEDEAIAATGIRDPSDVVLNDKEGALLAGSLLRVVDMESYVGREFECVIEDEEVGEILLGEEVVTMAFVRRYRGFAGRKPGDNIRLLETRTSSDGRMLDFRVRRNARTDYDVEAPLEAVCATHRFGVRDEETVHMWDEIRSYLKDGIMPNWCQMEDQRKSFVRRTQRYFLHEERIWKIETGGRVPRLVVEREERRRELLAGAHNDAGHRGRDATYKTLSERYYWPNLYNDVASFVQSCYVCQMRSRTWPVVMLHPTSSSAVLRTFVLDTLHMEDSYGGKKYLLQGMEPSIGWVEARAAKANNSEAWARFMYEDIICRFGCIPLFVVDGGSEFKGAAQIIYKQWGILVIVTPAYHPEANGVAERGHQTLKNSILKACGKNGKLWPRFVHAGLMAMRVTTSRMTGYSPYFLLYGRHPFFSFDVADRTWEVLAWDQVHSTEDLLALRIQQLVRRDKELVLAYERQKKARQKAVDDFHSRHWRQLQLGEYEVGTWVWRHETWLEEQKGNKTALRWAGPFAIHKKVRFATYLLRELDGTVMQGEVHASRLKLFYFREDFQTIQTVNSMRYGYRSMGCDASLDGDIVEPMNKSLYGSRPFFRFEDHFPTLGELVSKATWGSDSNLLWVLRECEEEVLRCSSMRDGVIAGLGHQLW